MPDGQNKKSHSRSFFAGLAVAIVVLVFLFLTIQNTTQTRNTASNSQENSLRDETIEYFDDSVSEEWRRFNPADGNFTASFPVYPVHETESVYAPSLGKDLILDFYTSSADEVHYVVGVSEYPPEIDSSNPKAVLEGALNGARVNTGSTVQSSSYGFFDGYRSLDYKMISKEGFIIQGKFVLAGQTIYQLMMVADDISVHQNSYEKFIESFEVKQE